jgi:hypothetical protein
MKLSPRALPLSFRGTLFDIKLVQFSLDVEEARRFLPQGFEPLILRGRAIVSLANVQLERMRLTWMPRALGFNYRHVAFRFLIDETRFGGISAGPGIFFVRSFTDRPLLARAADWLTYYRVARARIESTPDGMMLEQGGQRVSYRLASEASEPHLHGPSIETWSEAAGIVQPLDHAYGVTPPGRTVITRVLRPGWPIRPMEVVEFSTTFFETARLECGFRIDQPVPYVWQAPRDAITAMPSAGSEGMAADAACSAG